MTGMKKKKDKKRKRHADNYQNNRYGNCLRLFVNQIRSSGEGGLF